MNAGCEMGLCEENKIVLPVTLADTVFGAGGVALSGLPPQATYLEILEEYYYFYMRRCLYRASCRVPHPPLVHPCQDSLHEE